MPDIKYYPINSSTFKSIGWVDKTLYTILKNGEVVKYLDVPKCTFDKFRNHKFPGAYFGTNIKNKYKEEQIS